MSWIGIVVLVVAVYAALKVVGALFKIALWLGITTGEGDDHVRSSYDGPYVLTGVSHAARDVEASVDLGPAGYDKPPPGALWDFSYVVYNGRCGDDRSQKPPAPIRNGMA